MNHDNLKRLKEAKQYQLLAVKALLPDYAAEHMEVIRKEIKEMMMECMLELFSQEQYASHAEEKKSNAGRSKGVKKVDIS